MDATELALSFYKQDYTVLGAWHIEPGNHVFLGEREPRTCRFCGKSQPAVAFRLRAHAIPELLGNKSLFSLYECDDCNSFFGSGIENDFGNWSKPMRTLQRIRGKRGVPTMKSEHNGWRIECDADRQFKVNHARGDSVFTVYEEEKRVNFLLKRDPHVPIAVLKAFVKIGISLLPETEMTNFHEALQWIRNPIHRIEFELLAPVHHSFLPGAVALDVISTGILRRAVDDTDLPYAFLILSVGNEMFQVMLPSPKRDPAPGGTSRSMPPFPSARTLSGTARSDALDLSGDELVIDEAVSVDMTFEQVVGSPLAHGVEQSGEDVGSNE